MEKKGWFIDKDTENRWICHKLKRYILSVKTRFQNVELVETKEFGRVVILDKKIQSAEKDEFIYHEALVHPAMILHPNPEKVLILGGGEGATLREVLKHPVVRQVVMIDIDGEFVDLCKRYLNKWHMNSFDDPRLQLIIEDAMNYVKKTNTTYDVIIADISDPVEGGPAMSIYTNRFYTLVKKVLKKDGIFVTHATAVDYLEDKKSCKEIFKAVKNAFPLSAFYFEYVPSFSSLWAFAMGSLRYDPHKIALPVIKKRIKTRGLKNLLYYDDETHQRLFSIPKCLKKMYFSD